MIRWHDEWTAPHRRMGIGRLNPASSIADQFGTLFDNLETEDGFNLIAEDGTFLILE